MFSPFKCVYGSSDDLIVDNIVDLNNLHLKYASIVDINLLDYKKDFIPTIIQDVNDDTFKIVDAFGNDLESINGYMYNDSMQYEDIIFPANKEDYPDLYNQLGTPVIVHIKKENININKLFDKDYEYSVFNKILLERIEMFLNILCDVKLSEYNGQISEVGDGYVKLKDSDNDDNEVTINVNNDILFVNVDDIVSKNDYIEKNIFLTFNNVIEVRYINDPIFNINFMYPLEKIKEL